MNVRDNFPGTGTRADGGANITMRHENINDASLTADIAEDLARELPTQTLIDSSRGAYQRQIDNHRIEKARQQAIASAAMAKARQLTVSIRSLEDALDSLLASEA